MEKYIGYVRGYRAKTNPVCDFDNYLISKEILDEVLSPYIVNTNNMREPTPEELKSVNYYVSSISEDTCVNMFDNLESEKGYGMNIIRKKNIRKDLIEKELSEGINIKLKFQKYKLSKRGINKLLNHYFCHEFTEHFYDSEPELDNELNKKDYKCEFLDCSDCTKEELEDLKNAHKEVCRIYDEYYHSERRISFCNWIEVWGDGIWGMSQKQVDQVVYERLRDILKLNFSKKDRLYYAKNDEYFMIYFYGRDLIEEDYWFIMKKRKCHL